MTRTHKAYLLTVREQVLGVLRACAQGNVKRLLDTFLKIDEELEQENRKELGCKNPRKNAKEVLASFMKEVDTKRIAKLQKSQMVTKQEEIVIDNSEEIEYIDERTETLFEQ